MEDYGWAGRIIEMQMADAADVLVGAGASDLEKILVSCEAVIAKAQENDSDFKPTPRFLLQRVKGLKNATTARFVFNNLLSE
jgi:hypothetical protein